MSTLSAGSSFAAGAMAACMAVTVTNPLEVVKTRLQLQGELAKQTKDTPLIYKGVFQSMKVIIQREGIRGIQSGLSPAYIYQVMLNGSRLGFYEPCRRYVNGLVGLDPQTPNFGIGIFVGAITGALGAFLGSPLYLIKVRMQSYSPTMAVGEQTHYSGVIDAFRDLIRKREVFRGIGAAALRTSIGSSVQLPIYHASGKIIDDLNLVDPKSPQRFLLSGLCAGTGVAVVMSPPDVIMTRMYNQKGDLYRGVLDCVVKTVRSEGFLALYKGFVANATRIGPHTILTLTFMEYTMALAHKMEGIEHRLVN
uniref:Mitochondrial Oac1 n=1 Tax=Starmerella bombicola TaxID=75736 RepID=A0A6M8YH99_STABO|nr:mitochondrial Oac1 [Starmerella bombicola]